MLIEINGKEVGKGGIQEMLQALRDAHGLGHAFAQHKRLCLWAKVQIDGEGAGSAECLCGCHSLASCRPETSEGGGLSVPGNLYQGCGDAAVQIENNRIVAVAYGRETPAGWTPGMMSGTYFYAAPSR